jgi:hypothetical protein
MGKGITIDDHPSGKSEPAGEEHNQNAAHDKVK